MLKSRFFYLEIKNVKNVFNIFIKLEWSQGRRPPADCFRNTYWHRRRDVHQRTCCCALC